MRFRSVKGAGVTATFREAMFDGLAFDGGLYVPPRIPKIPPREIEAAYALSLPDLAAEILAHFIDDIPFGTLEKLTKAAFNFPIPLVKLKEDLFALELFHGPTLAFKDVGARFMAQAMAYLLTKEKKDVAILVATSGDTGSAVASAFHGMKGIRAFILYPSGRVSGLQEQQLTTYGGNIQALEVEGNFDDCQRVVKEAFADEEFVRKYNLTTANSINIARLLPQMVYYFWAIAELKKMAGKNFTAPVVVVPSGNFGNLTAALYAGFLGNESRKYIAATNANDVVGKYFQSGTYRPRASVQTYSNAMDVGNPSNLARIEFLFGRDLSAIKEMVDVVSIDDGETLDEIIQTYKESRYIADPHTAVGLRAARRFQKDSHDVPIIVASTAHPAKFPDVIKKALKLDVPVPPALKDALNKPKQAKRIGATLADLRKAF